MGEDEGVTHARVVQPRIIATDLDGTLLRSDGTVSERTQAALTQAEAAGLCIVFVTGRPPRWMAAVSAAIGPHGIAICSNGAAVYDVRRKELLASSPLPQADALALVRALRAELPGVGFAFEYPEGFASEARYDSPMWDDSGAPKLIAPAEEILASLGGDRVFKVLARHPTLDPDEFMHRARAAAGQYAEITRSSPMLEISATGVSKATTLARWCAERGVGAAEVVAFGDMPNDLPMLAWAGTAYAVANAHPLVLAATANHTADHDADGVAEVIEQVVRALPG
jgi:Cof subfamily protein (haloacid dehalogenase superfamily)